MRDRAAGIYKITCRSDGRVYVGQSRNITERLNNHRSQLLKGKNSNVELQNAWNEYGALSFSFDVIEICPPDVAILDDREIFWINQLCATDNTKGFNSSSGGRSGSWNAGMPEYRKAEIYKRISDRQKQYYQTHKHPNLGKPMSLEQKEKLRRYMLSEECALRGRKRPEHSKLMAGGGNPRARPVICVTTGERFESAKDAALKYGVTNSTLLKSCKGVQKQTAGMAWKFA